MVSPCKIGSVDYNTIETHFIFPVNMNLYLIKLNEIHMTVESRIENGPPWPAGS